MCSSSTGGGPRSETSVTKRRLWLTLNGNAHKLVQMRLRATLVGITGLALAGAAILAAHGLGVGSGPVCPRSTGANWNPYDGTAAEAQACDLTVYPLTGTTMLPDGGTRYVYQGPGNKTITETAPPPGFNPLKVSAAELALYGLPPEPPVNNPIARAHWLTEVESIKSWVTPTSFLYTATG
jgi:hypothetical protein